MKSNFSYWNFPVFPLSVIQSVIEGERKEGERRGGREEGGRKEGGMKRTGKRRVQKGEEKERVK